MKNLIPIAICISFLSCSTYSVKNNLKQFYSSKIIIPNNLSIINGIFNDSLEVDTVHRKLIIYKDSLGCNSCDINKMYLWQSYFKYLKSLNGKLKFYFIFHPSKEEENNLRIALANNSISYSVYLDSNGDFERLNPHLPKNKAMHTFLLDENNKVILVGNPLNNKEIEKLFYKKTQELLAK